MPAHVDFADPLRVESHLTGAWKESLIKDTGGILIPHAKCQIFIFILKSMSLAYLKEEFSEIQKTDTWGNGGQGRNTGQRGPLRAPHATEACELLTLPKEENKQSWQRAHRWRIVKDTFLIFKQVQLEVSLDQEVNTSKKLPLSLCNSHLSEGGREAHGKAAAASQRLPGRESTQAPMVGGDREPCHGLGGASKLVAAPYQNCSLWNMGSGQMKNIFQKYKHKLGEAVTLITLRTGWNGLQIVNKSHSF